MGMYCTVFAATPAELQQLLSKPTTINGFLARAPRVELEKSWHGLHYLLTGSATDGDEPLNFLLAGEPLGDDDPEDGPPRYLSPEAVISLGTALSALSDDELWSRFDPDLMESEGIYPGVWDEPEADLQEEYLTYFRELQKFVRQARIEGKALVVSVG